MTLSGESLIFLAKTCQEADLPREMFESMKQFISNTDTNLTPEERDLFNSACRSLLNPLKQSCRILKTIEEKEKMRSSNKVHLLQDKLNQVTDEFNCIFKEIMDFIAAMLLKDWETVDNKVFLLKVKANLHRDLYQVSSSPEESKNIAEQVTEMYKEAYDIAYDNLRATSALKLQIVLSLSIWYYEIMNDPVNAAKISQKAFTDAVVALEELPENEYRDVTTILQLLRDNLTLWESSLDDQT